MMKKRFLFAVLISLNISMFAQDFDFNAEPQPNEYIQYINSYDWGAATDKIILCLDHKVSANAVNKNDFEVKVHMVSKTNSAQSYGPALSERIVADAFICNSDGSQTEGRSNFISLLLEVHPEAKYSKPEISFTKPSGVDDFYGYKIENKKLELEIGKRTAFKSDDLRNFIQSEYNGSNGVMKYTMYMPEDSKKSEEKIPLIVWFHGLSEGGENSWAPLLGNPVPNLAKEKIQGHFKNGAAILVPQSKVSWLESDTKDKNGNYKWVIFDEINMKKSIASKVLFPFSKISSTSPYGNETGKNENTVSRYTTTVKELIDSTLKNNPQIDEKRIYLIGGSAGGYMVLNMGLCYPESFAALVACCPAYPFTKFNYNSIEKIYDKPMWIIYAKNDDTLKPEKYAAGVINRFENSGATDLHKSVFEKVTDTSGKYFKDYTDDIDKRKEREEKNEIHNIPYEYEGHASWIYLLNDLCSDGNINLFDWLAEQKIN